MTETKIKLNLLIENQLPQFILEEFPLVSEFLSQYYISLENQSGILDLLQNVDQYIKVDNLVNLTDSTTLTSNVTFFDSVLNVTSTAGFPDSYGLLLIDSEIITYTSKTTTTFEGCVRGFSGTTSYDLKDELTFTESESQEHKEFSTITNLSILFLKQFFTKIKKQFSPGFEEKELYSELNEGLFVKQSIDFYSSKGTDNSFKILFGALYGQNVDVIRPRDYLIQPSDAQYRITSDFVVESIDGNPEELVNSTLYQDKGAFIGAAQGTITKVEKIRRNNKDYYTISLDSDYNKDIDSIGSIFGKFSIHPKTKTISNILSESTTLEVDSTVGFPKKNGTLIIELDNNIQLTITYESKTLNQFLNCTGVTQNIPENTEIKTNLYAYGYSPNGIVKIRILSVLSDLELPDNTYFYSKNDTIKIKTLGIDLKDTKSNDWFFNIPVTYQVESIRLLDSSDRSYKIFTYDDHFFKIGDSITLRSSSGFEQIGYVISFDNKKSFSVQFGSEEFLLDTKLYYSVKKNIAKVNSTNYIGVNQYLSNIQNIYYGKDGSLYVASPSLPTYLNRSLKITDNSITFSGSFSGTILNIGKHGFYTGDSIVYKPTEENSLGISTGVYFIKKISATEVKLARSRTNIFSENFVSVNGQVTNAKFELTQFTYRDLSTKFLEPQRLIRKLSNPENSNKIYETTPGLTGIFINGVELLNYKSNDNVFYGPIENIIPTSSGSGYDIIDSPILTITDVIGSGAAASCSVIGGLERIDIIDPGFDYLEEPKVEIVGGNGDGASAKANLISFDHEVIFNSQTLINLNPTNKIGFSTYHKFRHGEEVVYITNDQQSVGGLSTNSTYFVSVQDAYNIKLHKSIVDVATGINTIQLSSYGIGNHIFKSKNKKQKIKSITIENKGINYQNNPTSIDVSGISTSSGVINIKNHGYKSGEIITYNATEIPIGGLSSSTSYFVSKIDDNQFKLSEIGASNSGITTSFYFETKQFVNITSVGSGIHKFNYPKIKVNIKGRIGVTTFSGQNFNAIVQPIFRGQIQSIFVESGGKQYGSEEIINYNRQPRFELEIGSGVELLPIISNGKIDAVLVKNSGSGYSSPPDLKIEGSGFGAVLTPIISNGSVIDVKVVYGGSGYKKENTNIIATSSGSGAKFEAQIKSWKINIVEKTIQTQQITDDDGILTNGLNSNYGLQYSHAYAPRNLRSSVQGTNLKSGKTIYVADLQLFNNKELTSSSHSPIIGWAYDGNPIYGPYGYTSKTGGAVKLLKSSYILSLQENRPSTAFYPQGFFVEDYSYVGNGDLDEYNGRFSVTPEYPNGVYAYFTTVNSGSIESTGLFENYRKPTFPYVIGNSFKSKPIDFNFSTKSNQDDIDINQTNWRRNITPYNILNDTNSYNYLLNPNTIEPHNSIVKSVATGSINEVEVISGGKDYKVGDQLVFTKSNGYNARAKVSLIKGKKVSNISFATSSFDNVVFYPYEQEIIGFTTIPHNYLNNDLISVTTKYDYKKYGKISTTNNNLILSVGVGSVQNTGLVTYFNVFGNLNYPIIEKNDIYQIGNEQIKILNIDTQNSRIQVLRNQNNTLGINSYSAGIALTERTRKFKINFGISTSYNFDINKDFYFDPKESVGLGTTSGVGIVSTLYFSNPGAGITQLNIPTQAIYIKNHNLNTGDALIYSSNGGTPVSVSTNGVSSFQLTENSVVYVAKLSNDLIGISTFKVGIGSTGSFIGISTNQNGILYFTSIGIGNTHRLKTRYTNILTGEVSKNIVTVSTAETHGLSLFDDVIVSVESGISTTFIVKYNDYNRRLLINPKYFTEIDVDNNYILINNHGYYTGQKVIYTSNTPSINLTNEKIYYVVVIDSNKIRLSNSYYESTKIDPDVVNILSSSPGTISPINPPIDIIKNQTVTFDLSDSSLSFVDNIVSYSAFDFKLYKNNEFTEEFDTTGSSFTFNVTKVGRIGIDSTAKLTINTNDILPDNLYYNLIPINLDVSPKTKKEFFVDDEVVGFNKISLKKSVYSGKQQIIGISSTSFTYNIFEIPEKSSYSDGITYVTSSNSAKGEIYKISVLNGGKKYLNLPGISSVKSELGQGAILLPKTNSIGKITSTEIQNIGFEYPSDFSVRPSVKLPNILYVDALSTIDNIKIESFGKNYNSIPTLVVIDSLTNKPINDLELTYEFGDTYVTIIKNSTEINNSVPKIIPTNNSNGIKISNITFNSSSKDVIVTLGSSFSSLSDFPFNIGDKVLIEGISVGIASTAKGYNSSNYNYALFTLKSRTPNIGGIGATVSYNLSEFLNEGEIPGTFNTFYSSGKIVPESHFPIFDVVLKKNNFYIGETVESLSSIGIVESWDVNNEYLRVATNNNFDTNQIVKGKTSDATGLIKKVIIFDSDYKIDAFSKSRKGWNTETGFLNNDFQRIHDSDYYQYFSYALKSKKDLNNWSDVVNSLNHTVGFKKFANLLVESNSMSIGIATEQNKGDFVGISDLSSVVSLNCYYDFDLVRENNLLQDGILKSNEVTFSSKILQDYIESVGNRVLLIDDLTNKFNSNPRPTEFSVVDTFLLEDFRSKKYIALVQDKRFTDDKQLSLISLIYNDVFGFVNQYGMNTLNNQTNLGFFDFNIFGTIGNLIFYPVKTKFNNYYVQLFSFSLNDYFNNDGTGEINLADIAKVGTTTSFVPQGTNSATTIVGIASTYRSSKLLVQISANDSSYYEYDEIILTHNGNEVYIQDYGQVSTNILTNQEGLGVGTYHAYISGSNINIDLIPYTTTSIDYKISAINVSIASTSSSLIGEELLSGSSVVSISTSILSSPTPTSTLISSYSNLNYNGSYSIISVEDITNSQYQVSEFLTLTNTDECYTTEFGIITTDSSLGIVTATISGSETNIYFIPNENIDVNVNVFQVNVGLNAESSEIPINVGIATTSIGILNYDYGDYTGTNNDIKKEFDLTSQNIPIFKRTFYGNNANIVNINDNTIQIPNHFYVTGEKIKYSYPGSTGPRATTASAIGIATTSITGIGLTDKLPTTLYVVRVDDLNIQVSTSASEALKTIPSILDLTSVGIGSIHSFTSTNQNKKAIISIDNLIQNPIVATSITTRLIKNVSFFDSEIFVSGISSIYGGDLIRIGEEVMKVTSVGVGSTNSITILRPWLGTGISSYSSSSLVTKVSGNYNIIDNTLYFSEAPYGKVPVLNPSNRPDELDYIGIVTSSSFAGRVFLRSGIEDSSLEPYERNYIFDDISSDFDGKQEDFALKFEGSNVTGISSDNIILLINSVFQTPGISNNYSLEENSGITSVTFSGNNITSDNDINITGLPRGGIILTVGSNQGFGYQPLISAGGTAIVSTAGTIQSISIGNSGSGYRSGIQNIISVGVKTGDLEGSNIEIIGTASVSNGHIVSVAITNPGTGYTSSNPPDVVFDAPLSYSNIPLIYSSQSTSGFGTGAVVDIIVGQGSSVISFEFKNFGYGYNRQEILTVATGGNIGIPTTSSPNFSEFQILVDQIYADNFSAWSIGNIQIIDSLDPLFDGTRTVFPILINGNQTTIRSRRGSNIDVQSTLLIFINDILQSPGSSYIFDGGSTIRFTQPPRGPDPFTGLGGDKSRLLFYKGTGDVDTQTVDILESIKVGDKITLYSEDAGLQQKERLVSDIVSSDTVETNLYPGPAVTKNETLVRPLIWCKQTDDIVVNGQQIGKNRTLYESYIQPTTNIIQNVGVSSAVIFVESIKSFFDSEREYIHDGTTEKPQNKIIIVSQDSLVAGAATAVVSVAGTISSIIINDGGVGYNTTPTISIGYPTGVGGNIRAKASSIITDGSVSAITITTSGVGYTYSEPPIVLIEPPQLKYEIIDKISYEGDFGIITGIKTTSVGTATTGLVFDFYIPKNSILRDGKTVKVGIATTGISGIQTGYYFVINNSNIGKGLTSLNSLGNVVGVGTTFIDNVYQVAAVSIGQTAVSGVGITNVTKVTVSVSNYNNLSGLGFSNFYGEFSWGRILTPIRSKPQNFTSYSNVGGISTSPIVQRFNRLKYIGYSTT